MSAPHRCAGRQISGCCCPEACMRCGSVWLVNAVLSALPTWPQNCWPFTLLAWCGAARWDQESTVENLLVSTLLANVQLWIIAAVHDSKTMRQRACWGCPVFSWTGGVQAGEAGRCCSLAACMRCGSVWLVNAVLSALPTWPQNCWPFTLLAWCGAARWDQESTVENLLVSTLLANVQLWIIAAVHDSKTMRQRACWGCPVFSWTGGVQAGEAGRCCSLAACMRCGSVWLVLSALPTWPQNCWPFTLLAWCGAARWDQESTVENLLVSTLLANVQLWISAAVHDSKTMRQRACWGCPVFSWTGGVQAGEAGRCCSLAACMRCGSVWLVNAVLSALPTWPQNCWPFTLLAWCWAALWAQTSSDVCH